MRQNEISLFAWANQDWIGLTIFKNFADQELDQIQFYRVRTGLGLKNFTVRSSLLYIGLWILKFERLLIRHL